MATEPAIADFDLGPLSWVQGEIDQALQRGMEALATFRAQPSDTAALKHARMHVHQAAGAIQMVGLDAVVAFTDEVERQLTRLEEMPADDVAPVCDAIDRACRKLSIFLSELTAGATPVPLKLFPEYEALQKTRGVKAVSPTDLFYPDLTPRAPKFPQREAIPSSRLPSHLVKQRRAYQRGLLAWLRGDEQGAHVMRDAIAAIEDATTQGSLRAFWWTVGALFEALTEHGLDSGFGVKQLAARIDLQIRRVVEGSAKAADRLRREVLYFVAISAPVGPQVQAVQRTFHLAAMIPPAESLSTDVVRLMPLTREAREQLAGVKDTWLKFASGRPENLPKLKQTLSSVHQKAAEMKHGALMKLTAALVERLDRMPAGAISEPLAMEYATALLLAESAFENFTSLSPDFPKQVDAMLARLDAVRAGRMPAGSAAPALDEMSKRAQERVLLAQVGREIQANLRRMEQVLDAFFRDPGKRAELASLARESQQVRGALKILGLDEADQLLGLCQQQIERYADPEAEVSSDDLELLAESLSGLGFYIEAVEQQRPDRDRLIRPLLARRLGEPVVEVVEEAESVEDAVDALRAELPKLVDAAHRDAGDPEAREDLKRKLGTLKDDAELIGDSALAAQAQAAIKELEAGGAEALAAAVEAIADTASPAPELSAETQRLLEVDAHAFDAELLDIYLTEASEVLDSVDAQHALLSRNPGDREALRTVRRGFHTLKGSGRMVGLTDLGEIAWEVEKIHNRLLEEERPVTGAVLAMIGTAATSFREWVDALRGTGRVTPNPAAVHASIHAVEHELPGGASVLAPSSEPLKPAPAPISLVPPLRAVVSEPARPAAANEAPTLDVAAEALAATSSDPRDVIEAVDVEDAIESIEVPPVEVVELVAADVAAPIELLDLPELGSGHAGATVEVESVEIESSDAIVVEDVTAVEHAAPVLKLVADNTRPHSPLPMPPRSPAPLAPVVTLAPGRRDGHEDNPLDLDFEIDFDAPTPGDIQDAPTATVPEGTPVGTHAIDARDRSFDGSADPAATVTEASPADLDAELPFTAESVDAHDAVLAHAIAEIVEAEESPAEQDAVASVDLVALDADEAPIARSEQPTSEASLPDVALPELVEPVALAPATLDAHADGEALPAIVSDEIAIGGVTLSVTLHQILVDEAEQHVATLEHELSLMQFDPMYPPSAAMIRASHTLCGIHRTGGFEIVARTAKALELALIALEQRGLPMPGTAQPVLARAIAGLRLLVSRIAARDPFAHADEAEALAIEAELEALRREATADELDAEAAAAAQAAREDESPTPVEADVPVLPAIAAEDEALRTLRDEVDEQVLSIFLEEAAELFPAAGEELRQWRRAPQDFHAPQQLRRTLHTFKGSARMAGAMRLGELAHLMESRLLDGDAPAPGTPELFEALDTDLDRIAYVLDKLRQGETNVPLPWLAPLADAPATVGAAVAPVVAAAVDAVAVDAVVVDALAVEPAATPPQADAVDATAPMPAPAPTSTVASTVEAATVAVPDETPAVEPAASIAPPAHVEPAGPATTTPVEPAPAAPAPRAPATGRADVAEHDAGTRAMLRVRADVIDRLVNEAGEIAITRARIEGELRGLKGNLLELTNSVIRLRAQVREIEIQAESQIQSRMSQMQVDRGEFDPLEFDRFTRFQELTRSLAEGVNDVSTVQQQLLRNLDDVDAALLAQARLSRDVQQQLFAIRTVPFGSLSERLYRIARSVSKELGKRANLEIVGGQTELDRSVLEKLAGPLEHLLRNALDHGVESRERRLAAGKAETGEITLTVRQAGNEIVIELADDGGGIDVDRVREKARAQGLIAADAEPTEAQLAELIFEPGFTTASRVTQISGRGVGMDVVRSDVAALGGRVSLSSRRGLGTTFTLSLPLTLAVAQAVLVRAGGRLWALPAPMVEQVQQVRAEAIVDLYVQRKVSWQGREYPFHYLPRLLGDHAHDPETARYNPVLLLRSGQGLAAVHVDEMVGNEEIVVKNVGPQLARVVGIAGATVLGNGEIVLILNPVPLAQRTDAPAYDAEAQERLAAHVPVAAAADAPPLVMVVDDSLTVRKITGRLLTREGFGVVTAKDGLDALQVLAEQTPDVILLDIEMPRMDGFEFTKTIKRDAATAHIPIIMITSRIAEKHRAHAAELGVDLYLGKPFQEDELLRTLREMLGVSAPA